MIINNVDTKDISVVVQGPIDYDNTKICLQSIREKLPQSEIILSTWVGSNTECLDYDILVLNEDPGYLFYDKKNPYLKNNINRQIVTTINGLKKAKTKYSIKIRTDFILTGSNFITFFDMFPKYENDYKIFEKKVLACCYFTRNPSAKVFNYPFHISDLFFFGLTSDIINLFTIELLKEDKAYINDITRYVPEQYIFINCIINNKNIKCDYYMYEPSQFNITETERYFASNFILLNFEELNIQTLKKNLLNIDVYKHNFVTCYTHIEWKRLYKKYADNKLSIHGRDCERKRIDKIYKNIIKLENKNNMKKNKIFSISKISDRTIIVIFGIKITFKKKYSGFSKKIVSNSTKNIFNNYLNKDTYKKIKIYIVTYKRNDVLNKNLKSLWSTAKRTDDFEVIVLANHPEIIINKENKRNNLKIVFNETRMPYAWGYLSRDWNYCIMDAFKTWKNPNAVDWVILAQNDVVWLDGWDEWIRNNKKYDFVSQPVGDQLLLLNIEAVKKVGFFDERFTTLYFHEIDYFIRASSILKERCSVTDGHSVANSHPLDNNPVGSILINKIAYGIDLNNPELHNAKGWQSSYNFMNQKYKGRKAHGTPGATLEELQSVDRYKEVNWYPFFWDEYTDIDKTFLDEYFIFLDNLNCQ